MKNNLFNKIWILVLSISLFWGIKVNAQCPPNIGYELNNFSSWQCFTGTCCPIAATTLGQVAGRHDIVSGTALDPFSLLPITPSAFGYGTYSLKLGNSNVGAEAERVRINFLVTPSQNTLIYRYHAVMQDGGHTPADQPRLTFNAIDQAGNNIICAQVDLSTPTGTLPQGWFISPVDPGVSCSNWIPVAVNLNSYIGQIVTIEFATGDCSQSGHFGYAYVDLACGSLGLSAGFCQGSTQAVLFGPPGFLTYTWDTAGTGLPVIQSGPWDTLSIPFPDTGIIYSCIVVPPAGGAGCTDTLYDTLERAPDPTANFGYGNYLCTGGFTTFYDSSITHVWGSYINTWLWNFGDPASGALNASTMQNPTHVYNTPGTYQVSLIVVSNLSCISDTIIKTIVINPPPPINPVAGSDVTICRFNSTTLTGSGNQAVGPFTVTWSPALTLSSTNTYSTTATPEVTTTYTMSLMDVNGCVVSDQVVVNVLGVVPYVTVTGKDTICPGDNSQLNVSLHPPTCKVSDYVCNNPSIITTSAIPVTSPTTWAGLLNSSLQKMQILYTKDYLNSVGIYGGTIQSLAFNVTNLPAPQDYLNFSIHMSCSNLTDLNNLNAFLPVTDEVYTTASYTPTLGWNTFNFNNKFNWDGINNIIIDVCYTGVTGVTGVNVLTVQSSYVPYMPIIYTAWGTSICNTTNWPSTFSEVPDFRFGICDVQLSNGGTYTWTPNYQISSTSIANPVVSPAGTMTYNVTVADNGCTGTGAITVYVDKRNAVDAGIDQSVCAGGTIQLGALASGPPPVPLCGANNSTCNGPNHTNAVGSATMQNTSTSGPTPFYGFYMGCRLQTLYSKTMLNNAGITAGTISKLDLNILAVNSVTPFSNFTIKMACVPMNNGFNNLTAFVPGATVVKNQHTFTAVTGVNSFVLDNTYDWDGVSALLIEYCFDNSANGAYTNNDVINLTTTAATNSIWYNADNTPAICSMVPGFLNSSTEVPDITLTICDAPTNTFQYTWTPTVGLDNPIIDSPICNVNGSTSYIVSTKGESGCIVKDTMNVTILMPFDIVMKDTAEPCKFATYVIKHTSTAVSILSYNWSAINGTLSCTNCAKPSVIPIDNDDTVIVYLTITDLGGCAKTDSIIITPISCPEIIVPSAFSPNKDGKNDNFFLVERNFRELKKFEVYNRWGQTIYSTQNLQSDGWDGKFKGEDQEVGVYVYNIEVVDNLGNIKIKQGNVTLLK